ncbi:hypothetical protein JZU56_01640, partial [bacterium]|nr:hypothetical protein [bacterium]
MLGGMVLSGGRVFQSFNSSGRLTGETISWTDELSSVRINANAGKLVLGIDTIAQSGNTVTLGARIRASLLIEVSGDVNSTNIGVVKQPSVTTSVAAATSAKQQSSVSFEDATLAEDINYIVLVNGETHTVKVGGAVTLGWQSILGELAKKLNATGVVKASVVDKTIVLVAAAANTGFSLSAYASDSDKRIGVLLPETAILSVANPDGVLKINSGGDARLMGQMLAGGEVLGHYDADGNKPGNT